MSNARNILPIRCDYGELSGQNGLHYMAVDVGETIVAALEFEGELFVVDTKEVKDRGLEVVDVDFVFHGIEADVITRSVGDTRLHAAAGHPDGVGVGMVIAAPLGTIVKGTLDEGRASEFAGPNDEGVFEEATGFKITDQSGGGLVGVTTLVVELGGERTMLVPSGMHELDKACSAFDETAREKTVASKGAGLVDTGAVLFERGFAFSGNVGELGHAGLHTVSHLVLRDARGNFGVADFGEFAFVELGNAVEHVTTEL